MGKHTTEIILGAVTLSLIGWDIWLACNEVAGDTISQTLLALARQYPSVPFVAGVLMGHLWWPQRVR